MFNFKILLVLIDLVTTSFHHFFRNLLLTVNSEFFVSTHSRFSHHPLPNQTQKFSGKTEITFQHWGQSSPPLLPFPFSAYFVSFSLILHFTSQPFRLNTTLKFFMLYFSHSLSNTLSLSTVTSESDHSFLTDFPRSYIPAFLRSVFFSAAPPRDQRSINRWNPWSISFVHWSCGSFVT